MFVITADQRASRTHDDLVPDALDQLRAIGGDRLVLVPERTAGDELQAAVDDAETVLALLLQLARTRSWSIGIGIGTIDETASPSIRAARGAAFVRARDAVDRAKRAPGRLAITGGAGGADAEALVRLLVDVRDRRTDEGWEVYDLLATGVTQREVAAALGISDAAVSLRARAAGLRVEEGAVPALVRALARADAEASAADAP